VIIHNIDDLLFENLGFGCLENKKEKTTYVVIQLYPTQTNRSSSIQMILFSLEFPVQNRSVNCT
jgi:hypothetical protein